MDTWEFYSEADELQFQSHRSSTRIALPTIGELILLEGVAEVNSRLDALVEGLVSSSVLKSLAYQ